MNVWDIILMILICAAVMLAVIHCVRVRKRGGCSCGGDCPRCASKCADRRESPAD